MKTKIKKNNSVRLTNRLSKKTRIRKKVIGTLLRPRLCVYRSLNHMYAQVIDDSSGKTIAQASSVKLKTTKLNMTDKAKLVGKTIAEECAKKKLNEVVFDRNGFLYHGRVKTLADSARENGLKF